MSFIPIGFQVLCAVIWFKWLMHSGRKYPIKPSSHIFCARRCECGSRELLGVESIGAFLRCILALGQCVGILGMLRREFTAKTGEILDGKVEKMSGRVLEVEL